MWGKLKDLNKLKDIAVDMVAPRTQVGHHDHSSDEDDIQRRPSSGHGTPTSQSTRHRTIALTNKPPSAASTPLPPVARTAVGASHFVDEVQDLKDHILLLQEQLSKQTEQVQIAKRQLEEERSQHRQQGSRNSSFGFASSGGDEGVAALKERIAAVERERDEVTRQAQQYSLDVKKSHDDTVSYFERRIQSQQEEHHQRLATLEASKVKLQAALTAENATLKKALDKLQCDYVEVDKELKMLKVSAPPVNELNTLQEKIVSLDRALAVVEKEKQVMQQNVTDLSRQIANKDLQYNELVKSHSTAATTTVSPSDGSETAAAIEKLTKSHQVALAAQRNVSDKKIKELQEEIKVLKERNAASGDGDRSDSIISLQSQVGQLESVNADLRAQLAAAASRAESLEAANSGLVAAKEVLGSGHRQDAQSTAMLDCTREIALLEGSVESLTREKELLLSSVTELEATMRHWKDRSESLDKMLVGMQHEAESLAHQLHAVTNAKGEAQLLVSTLKTQLEEKVVVVRELSQSVEYLAASEHKKSAQCEELVKEVSLLKARLDAKQAEFESLEKSKEMERSKRSHEEESINTMRETNQELLHECNRLRTAQAQMISIAQDALQKSNVQLPQKGMGIVELVTVLASELLRYHQALLEAQKVQVQWEQTYAQARDINNQTNAQLQEAWKQVQSLKQDVTAKERQIASLTTKLKDETTRWQEVQVSVASQQQHLSQHTDEKRSLEGVIAQLQSSKAESDEVCHRLRNELEMTRQQLQEREDEITIANRSNTNLQNVLEQFQKTKQREVDERTLYLNHEIESLKAELLHAESLKERHRDEVDMLHRNHRKELASKNMAVNSLQSKLTEMKKILEDTMSQLSDDHMIDKRVVSHLVVNFVNSVAAQRGDEEDMLKVMSGLLNWDDTMQQRAGLLPGPLNPRKQQVAASFVRGFVNAFTTAPSKREAPSRPSKDEGKSLAELWVEFLTKEGNQPPDLDKAMPSEAASSSQD